MIAEQLNPLKQLIHQVFCLIRKLFSQLYFLINFVGENINICWSPDGKCIAVGNKDDLIAFIDTRNYR